MSTSRRGARHRLLVPAALLLGALSTPARCAELVTEVLPIGYRDAAELLAVLRPLIPPPGSISAYRDQLVVRTTRDNMDEVRGVILELDRPPANLLISVRHTVDEEVRRDLAAVRAGVRSGALDLGLGGARASRRGAGATVRGGGTDLSVHADRRLSTRVGEEVQSVRVLEGGEAFIRSGESVPVAEQQVDVTGDGVVIRSGVRYEDFASGFYVRPRLHGHRVMLDVLHQRRELSADQRASVDEVSTTVSGIVGRWMELSGTDHAEQRDRRSLGSTRSLSTHGESGIYVKVERISD